jgi:hypothetical protein
MCLKDPSIELACVFRSFAGKVQQSVTLSAISVLLICMLDARSDCVRTHGTFLCTDNLLALYCSMQAFVETTFVSCLFARRRPNHRSRYRTLRVPGKIRSSCRCMHLLETLATPSPVSNRGWHADKSTHLYALSPSRRTLRNGLESIVTDMRNRVDGL